MYILFCYVWYLDLIQCVLRACTFHELYIDLIFWEYQFLLIFVYFLFFYSWFNRPLRAKIKQPSADLTPTWPQIELNDHPASLGVTSGEYVVSSAFDAFLDQNYRQKSVEI